MLQLRGYPANTLSLLILAASQLETPPPSSWTSALAEAAASKAADFRGTDATKLLMGMSNLEFRPEQGLLQKLLDTALQRAQARQQQLMVQQAMAPEASSSSAAGAGGRPVRGQRGSVRRGVDAASSRSIEAAQGAAVQEGVQLLGLLQTAKSLGYEAPTAWYSSARAALAPVMTMFDADQQKEAAAALKPRADNA